MIAHVRGTVAHRSAGSVVIDVGGVGYLVHVTAADHIPAQGQEVELHTSLQVREDSMTLYGFTARSSLVLFELLLSSSGVGPKLALAALGTHRPDVLRLAIAGGDTATLTAIPGVGKKVAERLVLDLKDKVGGDGLGTFADASDASGTPGGTAGAADPSVLAEVRDALLGLGYSASEVQAAMTELGDARNDPAADAADLLRRCLRVLGSGVVEGAGR
ncbi:MAG: Holliday junction branch migration protein RuvA [Nitriliruptor sp.]|nr:MAG: Holliday junction branch migration protein RuvA [Nitriliruptor sp.]